MSLSSLQLIALMHIPRIGKKTALKLSKPFKEIPSISDQEFIEIFSQERSIVNKQFSYEDLSEGISYAQSVLEKTEQQQISVVNIYEKNYPTVLKNQFEEKGQNASLPPVLFYKGNIDLLDSNCLLIIGSRNSNLYSEKAAEYLSENFAERNIHIVSGLALGCDTAAHKGALKKGKTIAVVGNGLDFVYPKENEKLASEILSSGGLILSEYEIGTPPEKYNLVERDKLQADVSNAVIVVQSSEKGGSMYAAKTAFKSQKKLFTVKFSEEAFNNSEECSGNRMLVKEFGASYIESSADKNFMKSYLDKISLEIGK